MPQYIIPLSFWHFEQFLTLAAGTPLIVTLQGVRTEEPLTEIDPLVVPQLFPGAEQKGIFRSNSN